MDEASNNMLQQLQGNPLFSVAKQQPCHSKPLPAHPSSNASPSNVFYPDFGREAGKHSGFPPASLYSQFLSCAGSRSPPSAAMKQLPPAGSHRSRSQPAFFSNDTQPPVNYRADPSPTTFLSNSVSADVSMDDHDVPSSRASPPLPHYPNNAAVKVAALGRDGLQSRKGHQRSQSDILFVLAPPFLPLPKPAAVEEGFLDSAKATAGVEHGNYWDHGLDADGLTGDDLFNAYMKLDGFDALNSSEDNRDDLNSRDSGSKTNAADSSENEADSVGLRPNEATRKEEMKRSAAADPTSRHCRSRSMDSFMGEFDFEEEPPKPLPSHGLRANSPGAAPGTFSLEFGNGQFTAVEMKKIMEKEKLVEMAMADPKRVKRILANRQSAARSKERKTRYTAELEHKVQTLQTETTTLSAQLTMLQRNSRALTNQNNELEFRLRAMEQQAQLRDALNEALMAEVHRLKLATTGMADATLSSNSFNSQICQVQSSPDLPPCQPENSGEMVSGSEQ